ncbi:hypothetical protein SLEP1_g59205, partial [Rubroshorea leprosula]
EGDPFTWCNRHPYPDTIRERIDRVLASKDWIGEVPTLELREGSHECHSMRALRGKMKLSLFLSLKEVGPDSCLLLDIRAPYELVRVINKS